MEIASSIVVPPLANTFSFDEDEEGNDAGAGLGELGEEFEVINVSPGTPQAALDYWNKEKLVSLLWIRNDDGYCGARISSGGRFDWRACAMKTPPSSNFECVHPTHWPRSVGGGAARPDQEWLDVTRDSLGGYFIKVPRSQNAKREAVFSRPVFALGDYPEALRSLLRHESLLAFEMPP